MAKFVKIAYKHNATVEALVKKALSNPNKTFKGGKAYTIVYATEFNGNLILEHYGTKIITVNPQTKEYTLGGGYSGSDADAVSTVFKVLGIPAEVSRKGGEFKVVEASATPTSPKPTNPAAEGYTWAWSSDLGAWVQAPKDNPGVVSMVGNTTGNQAMQVQASEEIEEVTSIDIPPHLVINYAKELYLDSHLTLPEITDEIQEKWPELDVQRAITLATKGYNAGKEGKAVSAGFMKDMEVEKEEQALALIDSFIKNQISIDELQLKLDSLELPEEVKNKFLSDAVKQNEDVASLVALEDLGTQTKTASQIKCFSPKLVEEGLVIQAGYDFKAGMKYKVSDKGVKHMLKVAKKLASQMK